MCFLGQLKVVVGQHLVSLCKTLLGTMLGVVLHFPLGLLGIVLKHHIMLSLGMPWDNLKLFQSDYCERFAFR